MRIFERTNFVWHEFISSNFIFIFVLLVVFLILSESKSQKIYRIYLIWDNSVFFRWKIHPLSIAFWIVPITLGNI